MKNRYLFFLLFFSLYSCATWRLEDIDSEYSFEYQVEEQEKIKLILDLHSYENYQNGSEIVLDDMKEARETTRSIIFTAYQNTQRFSVFRNSTKIPYDYKALIEVRRYKEFSPNMKWVTPLTLYLIPRSVEEKIVVTSKFYNRKNELVGMTESFDRLVTWHQLFMVLGLPLTGTANSQYENVISDLIKSSIEQAIQDGYFNS